MKVTVCFGSVRVLVPCGAGDLLVRDLVREATLRYKKATGQGPETWVGVRALRASSGGILDPDDRVRDVADDRETLTAECTNQAPTRPAPADGASGSSAGTASPDMFRGGGGVGGSMRVPNTDSCVEVGAADLEDGANGLQVRRGSEPTLHQDTLPPQRQVTDQTKRWSAAVVCRDDSSRVPHKVHPLDGRPPDPTPDRHGQHFQRQSNRLSMQFSGPGSGVWLDAADKVQIYGSKSLPRDARKEPLGQDTPPSNDQNRVEDMLRWVSGVNNVANVHPVQERPLDLLPEGNRERAVSGMEVPVSPSSKHIISGATQTVPVTLVKGEKGLGFTITTRDNPTGGHCPIYIKNILPKGAAVTDGRLRAGDRLVSVNKVPVAGLTQQQVVTLLRNTPTDAAVDIVVERTNPHRTQRVEPQQSPTKYVEKSIGSAPITQAKPIEANKSENGRVSTIVNAINQHNPSSNSSVRGRIPKSSSKDDLLKDQSIDTAIQEALNSSSSSLLGLRNRLIMRLDVPVHDSEKAGLGISVKGKVTVGPDPHDLGIFIKSVLHGGAASRDGRLHTNDQLLSVNGVSLVGQSNAEAMETLRRALLHSRPNVHGSISLTIARRTDSMDSLARWKDDTPPNGNDTTNSNENSNSQNFNTVIYNTTQDKENKPLDNYNQKHEANQKDGFENHDTRSTKKHASIITINNNNSWVSNQSDDSKGYLERDKDTMPHDSKRDSFEWSRLDGWNPVIDRLTGLRNESYYMATQLDAPLVNGHHYRQNLGHVHMARSPPAHHNVIIEEDYGTRGSTAGESGSESGGAGGAFSRDAVGRRSMSEKRHAALDARATGTYRKIKETKAINGKFCCCVRGSTAGESGSESGGAGGAFSRDAVGRRSMSEKRHAALDARATGTYRKIKETKAINGKFCCCVRGSTAGESGSESGGAGGAFSRDAVGRRSMSEKRHAALDARATGTYRKIKETKAINAMQVGPALGMRKSSSLESLQTAIQETQRKPIRNEPIYARAHPPLKHWLTDDNTAPDTIVRGSPQQSSLSHKKPSLLKSLSTMFRIGKPSKKPESEVYGRTQPGRSSEKSISRDALERRDNRIDERIDEGEPALPVREESRSQRQGSSERIARSERRSGQRSHARTAPAPQAMDSAWGPTGHYVNYEEIQQNLNARREKLSEVQIGQVRRGVHREPTHSDDSRRAGPGGYNSQRSCKESGIRPQSNYYEYESAPPPRRPGKLSHYH